MTPADSIAQFVLPNGRKLGLFPFEQNPNLFDIKYADNKPGELPDLFKDQRFTKRSWGEEWIRKNIEKLWESAMKQAHKAKAA
jgi:hypothetical protein